MDSWGIQAKGTWATLRNNNRYKVNWDEGAKQRLQTGWKRVWGTRLKLQLKDTWTRQKHWQHTELLRGVRVKLIKQKRIWTRKCWDKIHQFSSVQSLSRVWLFATPWCQAMHARPPCLSPTPRVYSNSCPSSRWCHPTISPSVVPFSSSLQSFPVSGSFQMSCLQIFFFGKMVSLWLFINGLFTNSFYLLIIPKKIVAFSPIIVWKNPKWEKNFHELGSIFHLYGTRAYIHIWQKQI